MLWPGSGAETPMAVRREAIVLMHRPEERHALLGQSIRRDMHDAAGKHGDQHHVCAADRLSWLYIATRGQQILHQFLKANANRGSNAETKEAVEKRPMAHRVLNSSAHPAQLLAQCAPRI